MIRTILKLAFVALVANATWHLFGAYYPHYKFKDGVQYVAQFRGTMSDDALREKIVDLATQFEIPVAPGDLSITTEQLHTTVQLSYVRPVDLAPGFTYPWPFSVHVDTYNLGSLK
jgi:hypothetical protein